MLSDADRAKDIFLGAIAVADRAARAAYVTAACGAEADLRRWVEELLATFDRAAAAAPPVAPDATTDFQSGAAPPADEAGPMATTDYPSGPEPERTTDFVSGDAPPPDPTATTDYRSVAATSSAPTDLTTDHVPGAGDDSPPTAPTEKRKRKADSEIGKVIAGKYTLVGVVGEGGMGSVYLARQSEPVKRDVALKLIKAGFDSRNVLARFEAERQALALMEHPNIARVYDGGTTDDGWPFFAMELVRGKPITRYCDENRLPPAARLDLFVQVCRGVQHAHQKGIIHRDLKPGNILVMDVDGKPTPKIIDFGVAKATEQKLTDVSFSDVGAIVGTPVYMSPEQADPSTLDIDTRTDVYALGVVLYELLTGTPPLRSKDFKRGAILEMLRMVREVEPPRPSTRLSEDAALPNIAANRALDPGQLLSLLRGDIDSVVMKSLEKDRDRRYESANGFAADIMRYLANEPVAARAPTRGYRLRKFVRRNRAAVTAVAAFAVLLTAGVIGIFVQWREAEFQRGEAVEARGKADTARGQAETARGQAETARGQAEMARAKADENYKVAMAQRMAALKALGEVVTLARKEMPKAPGTQDVQKKVLDVVGTRLKDIIGNPFTDVTLNDNTLAAVYEANARLAASLGDVALGIEDLRKAEKLLDDSLRAAAGKADEFQSGTRQNLALIEMNLAFLVIRAEGTAKAKAHLDRARDLLGDVGPTAPAENRVNLANLYRMVGLTLSATDLREARKLYGDSLRVMEDLARDRPSDAVAQDLVASIGLVAAADFRLRDPTASEQRRRQAVRIAEGELAKAGTTVWKNKLAHAHDGFGDFLLRTGKTADAVAEFKAALALFAPIAAADAKNVEAAADHARALYSLALAEVRAGDKAAAAGHFKAALDIREARARDKPERSAYTDLMVSLAQTGRPKEAVEMADMVTKKFGPDANLLIDTACCLAIAAGVQPADDAGKKAAEEYAQRAVRDLEKAVQLGYREVVNLETEPELDALRQRDDFKKLLADLAAKAK